MNSYIWIHIGRRFAAALLPPLLGKNPRSHQKGATSRVRTGDQWLPILCHCQLGQDIYLWTHIRIQNLYILFHIHEFINTWIHIFISYMNPYVHEFIWSLNIWIHMYVNSYMLIHMYMNYEHVNSFVYDCFYNSHYHMSCIVSRQWPEVYDLCHLFARFASQKTHGHARMQFSHLTRATCKNVRQNLFVSVRSAAASLTQSELWHHTVMLKAVLQVRKFGF